MVKSTYWQSIRGICILAVVLIHALGGYNYVDDTAFIILRQIINFAVATFIFMAGYFIDENILKSNDFDFKRWFAVRGGRLLVPFVIWSLFYTIISIAYKFYNGATINWLGLLLRFFAGKAAVPFYYIVVLLQLTVLTPFLVKSIKKKGLTEKLLWLVTPAYIVYVYAWNFITGNPPFLYETFFPAWFLFYYLGIKVKGGMKLKGTYLLLFVTFIFSCIEALALRYCGMNRGFYTSQITLGSFMYTVGFIAVILKAGNSRESILAKLGDCSYGIFYIHMFILMIIGKVLNTNDSWFFYWSSRFMLTSLISYGIVRISQHLFNKNILKWIGFV